MIKVVIILLVLAMAAGTIWFFTGPAKAVNKYVNELASSITRRDDAVLFRQLYQNKQPRNVVLAWVLATYVSPTVSYIYQRQGWKALLSFVTLEGLGLWWIVGIFSTPFEVMGHNKRLADQAYAELRLARPEMLSGAGSLAPPTPQGLNPEALGRAGHQQRPGGPVGDPSIPRGQVSQPSRTRGPATQLASGQPSHVAPLAARGSRSCPACGSPLAGATRFCGSCGTPLATA